MTHYQPLGHRFCPGERPCCGTPSSINPALQRSLSDPATTATIGKSVQHGMLTEDATRERIMTDTQTRSAMLSGCRVLDFTQYLAGPTVTRLMAEMGAHIIKVEQAPMGDPSRLLPFVKNG